MRVSDHAIRLLPLAKVHSSLAIDGPANATWNTVVEAVAEGGDGNLVTLTATAGGSGTGAITVVGNAVTFTFQTGVTTVANFEAALAGSAAASAIMRVKTPGTTPAYALLAAGDAFAATPLTGGGATASVYPTSLTDRTIGKQLPFPCDEAVFLIRSVAGSGTMTATVRIWGFFPAVGRWYALGTGTAQGVLNGGVAVGEISTGTNQIAQAEGMAGLRYCSDLKAEIVGALGGTATEIELHAVCRPPGEN